MHVHLHLHLHTHLILHPRHLIHHNHRRHERLDRTHEPLLGRIHPLLRHLRLRPMDLPRKTDLLHRRLPRSAEFPLSHRIHRRERVVCRVRADGRHTGDAEGWIPRRRKARDAHRECRGVDLVGVCGCWVCVWVFELVVYFGGERAYSDKQEQQALNGNYQI